MYEYKYVDILTDGTVAAKITEHRGLIDRYAAEGWRYVGFLPTHISRSGVLCNIDLIFEREYDHEQP